MKLFLRLFALLLSTVPVIAATLSYFPLWKRGGAVSMISGFTLLLLLLSIVPLIRLLKRIFASPTASTMWLIIFLIFLILKEIADEMVVIAFIGYISNLLASFIWRYVGRVKNEG